MDLASIGAAVKKVFRLLARGVAVGRNAVATAPMSCAFGDGAGALARGALAVGEVAQVNAPNAVAIGPYAYIAREAAESVTVGGGGYVEAPWSIMVGNGFIGARCPQSMALGYGVGISTDSPGEDGALTMVIGIGSPNGGMVNYWPRSLIMGMHGFLPSLCLTPGDVMNYELRGKVGIGCDPDHARLADLADGGCLIGGDLLHIGDKLGFYGAGPVPRPAMDGLNAATITHPVWTETDPEISDPVEGGYGFASAAEFRAAVRALAEVQQTLADLLARLEELGLISTGLPA